MPLQKKIHVKQMSLSDQSNAEPSPVPASDSLLGKRAFSDCNKASADSPAAYKSNETLQEIMSYKTLPLEEQVLLFSPKFAWPSGRSPEYPKWTRTMLTLTYGSVLNRIFDKLIREKFYIPAECTEVPVDRWVTNRAARSQRIHLLETIKSKPDGVQRFHAIVDAVLISTMLDNLKHTAASCASTSFHGLGAPAASLSSETDEVTVESLKQKIASLKAERVCDLNIIGLSFREAIDSLQSQGRLDNLEEVFDDVEFGFMGCLWDTFLQQILAKKPELFADMEESRANMTDYLQEQYSGDY